MTNSTVRTHNLAFKLLFLIHCIMMIFSPACSQNVEADNLRCHILTYNQTEISVKKFLKETSFLSGEKSSKPAKKREIRPKQRYSEDFPRRISLNETAYQQCFLLLLRRIHRANIRACAAFYALALINDVFAVACADALHRAFIFACAAINTRLSNNISHIGLLEIETTIISRNYDLPHINTREYIARPP